MFEIPAMKKVKWEKWAQSESEMRGMDGKPATSIGPVFNSYIKKAKELRDYQEPPPGVSTVGTGTIASLSATERFDKKEKVLRDLETEIYKWLPKDHSTYFLHTNYYLMFLQEAYDMRINGNMPISPLTAVLYPFNKALKDFRSLCYRTENQWGFTDACIPKSMPTVKIVREKIKEAEMQVAKFSELTTVLYGNKQEILLAKKWFNDVISAYSEVYCSELITFNEDSYY